MKQLIEEWRKQLSEGTTLKPSSEFANNIRNFILSRTNKSQWDEGQLEAFNKIVDKLGDLFPVGNRREISIGRIVYDSKDGIGNTPNGQEVDYRGFTAWMTPQDFLNLNPDRGDESEFLAQHFQKEGDVSIAPCWIYAEYVDGTWQVNGHEGRGRAIEINKIQPEKLMPVHVFPSGEFSRAAHLAKEMLFAPIQADHQAKNPSFQVETPAAIWQGKMIER